MRLWRGCEIEFSNFVEIAMFQMVIWPFEFIFCLMAGKNATTAKSRELCLKHHLDPRTHFLPSGRPNMRESDVPNYYKLILCLVAGTKCDFREVKKAKFSG
jgi:hypothetical protein